MEMRRETKLSLFSIRFIILRWLWWPFDIRVLGVVPGVVVVLASETKKTN